MLQLQGFTFNAFSENTFLLTNAAGQCWVVDPGMNSAEERDFFRQYLEEHHLKPVAILNTHTHIDHIFGAAWLIKEYGVPFGMHEADLPVLAGAKGSAMLFGFTLDEAPQPDFFIREGEPLLLGEDLLEVRLVPGHSPGSIVFYNKAAGWVIAGDTLFAGGVGRSDLPGGNEQTLYEAIRSQLLTLPDETVVVPGHGPVTTVGAEKTSNPFLNVGAR